MSAIVPRTPEPIDRSTIPVLEAPAELVEEYLALVAERRAREERLAYLRAELELVAASALTDAQPRARFLGAQGAIAARLSPTCFFDRANIARELQRMGRLHEVAMLQGPAMARYLLKEPLVAARLGAQVRMRRSIVMMAADR